MAGYQAACSDSDSPVPAAPGLRVPVGPLKSVPERAPCEPGPSFIAGPAGRLEVLVSCPDPAAARNLQVVICHPHPLYGGSMQNKVVYTLARVFTELGAQTVRFNFRGVGQSDGSYDRGIGESDDLVAVADWVAGRNPAGETWFAGFSFGAYVALRTSGIRPVSGMVLVAPPVNLYDFSVLPPPGGAALVLQGDADEVVPLRAVQEWVQSLAVPPRLEVIPGASHFFHQRLNDLRAVVQQAVTSEPDTGPRR